MANIFLQDAFGLISYKLQCPIPSYKIILVGTVISAVPEPLGEHQKPLGAAGKYILPVPLADFLFYIIAGFPVLQEPQNGQGPVGVFLASFHGAVEL